MWAGVDKIPSGDVRRERDRGGEARGWKTREKDWVMIRGTMGVEASKPAAYPVSRIYECKPFRVRKSGVATRHLLQVGCVKPHRQGDRPRGKRRR